MTEPLALETKRDPSTYTDDELAELTELMLTLEAYRKHKSELDDVEAKLKVLRDKLYPLVEAHGKYQDEHGYARIVPSYPVITYNAKTIDDLCASDDDLMRKLYPHRKVTTKSPYLQIK